jgi:hypothetical protein
MIHFNKFFIILFLSPFFTYCGYKAAPEPFFATSPSYIDKEISRRKAEKTLSSENKEKNEDKKEKNN